MRARATSRKRGWFDSLLLAGVLIGLLVGSCPPVEAAQGKPVKATPAKKKAKPVPVRKPSAAHQKLRAAIDDEGGAGEQVGEGRLGAASFYGFRFQGRKVASGERFDVRQMTAASNHYPLGSWVAVRRADSERCVVVKVNDRMHTAHRTRIIDLSRGAAEKMRMISAGVILVRVARLPDGPGEDAEQTCTQAFAGIRRQECSDCVAEDIAPLRMAPHLAGEWGGLPTLKAESVSADESATPLSPPARATGD